MGTKFTPGPWANDRGEIHRDAGPYGARGANNTSIAMIVTMNGDRDTASANARLIAAAPDLLESLEEALRVHGDGYSWGAKASAAISRATGEG